MESYRKITLDKIETGKIRILGTVYNLKDVSRFVRIIWVDDGFGEVRVKIFEKEKHPEISIGDIMEVFGEIREDDRGKYVFPEKIFKRNIYYELYRLLELKDILPEKTKKKEMIKEENESRTYRKEDIIEYIVQKLSEEDKITIEELYGMFRGSEEIVDAIIEEFKKEGIIFEEQPGVFRRL